jgi:hypothetical protein
MASPHNIIFDAYCKLSATRGELQNNWICNQTLLRLLNAHYPNFKNSFDFTQALLIRAISAKAGPFHRENEHGIFVKQFQTSCPYEDKRWRVTYFYRQINGEPPANPASARDITDVRARNNQIWRNAFRGLVTNSSSTPAPAPDVNERYTHLRVARKNTNVGDSKTGTSETTLCRRNDRGVVNEGEGDLLRSDVGPDDEINTKKHVTHKVKPGWEGKGKGMLQILYERGWICREQLDQNKKKVVDDAGLIVKEYSLGNLLETCTNFANKKTQLEYVCGSLGVKVLITTKYHAEYAGEGIAYSWGTAKAIY